MSGRFKNRNGITPVFSNLKKIYSAVKISKRDNISSPEEIFLESHSKYNFSRRNFLKGTISLGAISALPILQACSDDNPGTSTPMSVDIAIVGAGLAGLTCAYYLKKAGYNATLFEAATRNGGRISTSSNLLNNGQTTELGGEFIDSSHDDMHSLVNEFGLTLYDTQSASETALIKDAYYFGGQERSLTEVIASFSSIIDKLDTDYASIPDTLDYMNPGAQTLDNMSLADYINSLGADPWFADLLTAAYTSEFGLDTSEQTSLNLLYMISTDTTAGTFDIFGESDERYKIAGGNSLLINKLEQQVQSQIKQGYQLTAMSDASSGKYTLTFKKDSSYVDVTAKYVVMAIPFSVLRKLDIKSNLPAVKKKAIAELGYGTNSKLLLGFTDRNWRTLGYSGYSFSDLGIQNGWDNTQLQPGDTGGYTVYLGGKDGVDLGKASAATNAVKYLDALEKIFPGTKAKYNNKASSYVWGTNQYSLGSYSCYKPGQFNSISGSEIETAGNIFFAGEHCSIEFQGFMNGAASTGRIAAEELIKVLKLV